MGMIKEFKEFSIRGNVVDMAVGIIIGSAFGKIVSSFVADVLMLLIGVLSGAMVFTSLAFTIRYAAIYAPAFVIAQGKFIKTVIVALAIFTVMKAINSFKQKEEEALAAEM